MYAFHSIVGMPIAHGYFNGLSNGLRSHLKEAPQTTLLGPNGTKNAHHSKVLSTGTVPTSEAHFVRPYFPQKK